MITTRQPFSSAIVVFLIGTILVASAQYFWIWQTNLSFRYRYVTYTDDEYNMIVFLSNTGLAEYNTLSK